MTPESCLPKISSTYNFVYNRFGQLKQLQDTQNSDFCVFYGAYDSADQNSKNNILIASIVELAINMLSKI